jgi:hypothetical protein
MELYKVNVIATPHGYCAKQPDFDLAIDADTVENAVRSMKNQIEQEGVNRMKNGKDLPRGATFDEEKDADTVYIATDIELKFKESATESVRKNISMPAWMDIQLRKYGVDASKLFQEAATAYIEKQENKGFQKVTKSIMTLEELKSNVNESLLHEYAKEYLKNML